MQEPQQAQPEQANIAINVTQDALVVALGEQVMHQIVMKWLADHPALLAQVAKQATEAKKAELQVIRHIKQSKIG